MKKDMEKNILRNVVITGVFCFVTIMLAEYINFCIQGENSNPQKHVLISFVIYVVALLLATMVYAIVRYVKKKRSDK